MPKFEKIPRAKFSRDTPARSQSLMDSECTKTFQHRISWTDSKLQLVSRGMKRHVAPVLIRTFGETARLFAYASNFGAFFPSDRP